MCSSGVLPKSSLLDSFYPNVHTHTASSIAFNNKYTKTMFQIVTNVGIVRKYQILLHKNDSSSCLFFGNLVNLAQDNIGIQILQCIKDRHGLAVLGFTCHTNLCIPCPCQDGLLGYLGQQGLTKGIVFNGSSQPIEALGHGFKGTGTGVDTIVAGIGLGFESQLFVLVQNSTTDGSSRSRGRIGSTEDLATEIFPRQGIRGPLDRVPLDLFTGIAVGCLWNSFIKSFVGKKKHSIFG